MLPHDLSFIRSAQPSGFSGIKPFGQLLDELYIDHYKSCLDKILQETKNKGLEDVPDIQTVQARVKKNPNEFIESAQSMNPEINKKVPSIAPHFEGPRLPRLYRRFSTQRSLRLFQLEERRQSTESASTRTIAEKEAENKNQEEDSSYSVVLFR